MKHPDLDQWLKSAPEPERNPRYWETFPRRVSERIEREKSAVSSPAPGKETFRPLAHWPWKCRPAALLWGMGFATACVLLGFAVGVWKERNVSSRQTARLEHYLREMQALFPNQVRAIIFEAQGPRLVISEKPDVSPALPVWVRLCERQQPCTTILTFSGQQIQINGETCEVLLGVDGNILLVGSHSFWSSADAKPTAFSRYHIEAQPLERL